MGCALLGCAGFSNQGPNRRVVRLHSWCLPKTLGGPQPHQNGTNGTNGTNRRIHGSSHTLGPSCIGARPRCVGHSYLAGVGEPKRSTLQQLRQCVLDVIPNAQECISLWVAPVQGQGQDGRRVRRVQKPPELPAAQRLSPACAGRRPRRLRGHQRVAAPSRGPAAPARLGEQAGRDPSAGAWSVGRNARRSNALRAKPRAMLDMHAMRRRPNHHAEFEVAQSRDLASPDAELDWVRDLRAAGQGTLSNKGQTEILRARGPSRGTGSHHRQLPRGRQEPYGAIAHATARPQGSSSAPSRLDVLTGKAETPSMDPQSNSMRRERSYSVDRPDCERSAKQVTGAHRRLGRPVARSPCKTIS